MDEEIKPQKETEETLSPDGDINAYTKQYLDNMHELNKIDFTGSPDAIQRDVEDKAYNASTVDLVKRGFFSGNSLNKIGMWMARQGIESDPNFKITDNKDLYEDLPMDYHSSFSGVASRTEGLMIRDIVQKDLDNQQILSNAGMRGMSSLVLAGIIDVDAPLMFMSGGGYTGGKIAALAEKAGMAGSRITQVARFGAGGAEAGLLTSTAGVLASPTGDWRDVPMAGLSGLAFGSTVGAVAGKHLHEFEEMNKAANPEGGFADFSSGDFANKSAKAARDEFNDAVNNGTAGKDDIYGKPVPDDVFDFADSFNYSEKFTDTVTKAKTFLDTNKVLQDYDSAFKGGPVVKVAEALYKFKNSTPLRTDFDRLFNSGTSTGQVLAYKMFENAAGLVRNNKSASNLNDLFSHQIAAPVNLALPSSFKEWARARYPKDNPTASMFSPGRVKEFHKDVIMEMQSRYHDNVSHPTSHPAVIAVADAVDIGAGNARRVLKGNEGEIAVRGSEELADRKGWFRQVWNPNAVHRIAKEIDGKNGMKGMDVINDTLAKSYMKVHGWEYEFASKIAKAVTRRAMANKVGLDTNVFRLLDEEGTEYMRQFLKDGGMNKEEIDTLVDALKGAESKRNKESFLKSRNDIDLRVQIPGTDYTLIDLIDTDIPRVWTQYARRAGGAGALARNGIQRADKREIINSILAEQTANGGKGLDEELLNNMFSYFDGGAFAGGVNPWLKRTLMLGRLSNLSSLGLTQTAETGVGIAAVGYDNFVKAASAEMKGLLRGTDTEIAKNFKPWLASIEGEEKIMLDHLMLDEYKPVNGMYPELQQGMDRILGIGAKMQGYLSGFFAVRQLQQKTIVHATTVRLADHFMSGKHLSDKRLYDLGFTDEKMTNRIGKYFTDGTVTKTTGEDGNLNYNLNPDKWKMNDWQDFVSIIQRAQNQSVQKMMRGEGTVWFSKPEGQILMDLKTFSTVAIEKQLIRNMRIADTASTQAFIYSAMTAAVVYAAQQASKGNTDRLDSVHIMKGAFQLGNMTGWLPMMTDPVASMLGMDSLRFSNYNVLGAGGDIIGPPPSLTNLTRVAHIPAATVKTLTGNATKDDIYALKATPIIGNLYGMSYIFNQMQKDAPFPEGFRTIYSKPKEPKKDN